MKYIQFSKYTIHLRAAVFWGAFYQFVLLSTSYIEFACQLKFTRVSRAASLKSPLFGYCNMKGSDERLQNILTIFCAVLKKKKVDQI